jgi:outer membrane immunogenic protein
MRARLIIAGLLATVAALGTASAADLGQPVYTKAPPPPAPFFYNWSGFYIGVNVGGSWGHQDTGFTDGPFGIVNSNNINGVIGGGQVGWNWQGVGSPWVFGLETDLQGSGQKHSGSFDDRGRLLPGSSISFENKLEWFGTTRGRIGYAIGDQGRWLPYITGGFAYGSNKVDGSGTLDGTSVGFSQSKTDVGWTLGGGVEWAFADQWSAKLEYLYVDLNTNHSLDLTPLDTITSQHLRDNIVRAGVNLHF